ncbi:hypothetical protein DFJ74DRAFT_660271 [Hyaloraphidium curvatum]|nr:hypothetical protein DFJ74DRAFT_660271 [Hyaloraphidium curvatum]
MNAKAAARFRRTPDAVRGVRLSELLDPAELPAALEPYRAALAAGEPQVFEHSGPAFPALLAERSAATLRYVGRSSYFRTAVAHIGTNRITGNPICAFFEADVTRYRKQEKELVAKNAELAEALGKAEVASKAKDDFLGMVSHEIRTPLNGILGHLALLRETHLEEQQLEYLETVTECSEGLLSLVNDILDLSRIAANKIELDLKPFDLHTTMRTSFAVYKTAEPRLRMVLDVGEGVPDWVVGDGKRLRQVVINLLSNAVKFTEQGGTVECRVRSSPSAPPPGAGEEHGEWACISVDVRDSGIGIPADAIGKLFQPFQQIDSSMSRKYQGTGLGLAICRKIVELMHGAIWVTSEPGKGSVFSFRIFLRKCPEDLEGGEKSLERKKQAIVSNRVRMEREIMAIEGAPEEEVSALGKGLSGSLSPGAGAGGKLPDEIGDMVEAPVGTLRDGYLGAPPRTGAGSRINTLPRGQSGPLPHRPASPGSEPQHGSLDRSLDRRKAPSATRAGSAPGTGTGTLGRSDTASNAATLGRPGSAGDRRPEAGGQSPASGTDSLPRSANGSLSRQNSSLSRSNRGSLPRPIDTSVAGTPKQAGLEVTKAASDGAGLSPSAQTGGGLSPGGSVDRAGSGFSDGLPAKTREMDRESHQSAGSLSVEAKESYSHLHILIAEDNKINRNLLIRVLTRLGVAGENITTAENGEEACEVVFARPTPFDIVFMDLSMPIRSGIESTRMIRQTLPVQRQPKTIVALTANAFEATRKECLAAGMDSFLTKPFRMHEIAGILDAIALQIPRGPVSPASPGMVGSPGRSPTSPPKGLLSPTKALSVGSLPNGVSMPPSGPALDAANAVEAR